MENQNILSVASSAANKVNFFKTSKEQYAVYSIIAGCFCSIGMVFAYSAGAGVYGSQAFSSLYKLAIGISFALSFTLIIFAGSELFTGNVLVMTIGMLEKKITIFDTVKLLALCYAANITGAVLMGLLFASTGLLDSPMGKLLLEACKLKTQIPFMQALSRGILCNVLVCLGTWCVSKLKSESGKMIVLVWVVAGFVTPGFEHSIANAGLFTMAAFVPGSAGFINFQGILSNMIPVTIGNIIGGSMLVGLGYWFSGKSVNNKISVY